MRSELEKKAEGLFKHYAKQLIKLFGTKPTWSDQLLSVGRQMFGMQFVGVYSVNEKFPIKRGGMYLINTDPIGKPGEHWISLYIGTNGNNAYIYDSFGRQAKCLVKALTRRLEGRKFKIKNSDLSDKEQKENSDVCGPLSLAWLLVVKRMGIRAAMLI